MAWRRHFSSQRSANVHLPKWWRRHPLLAVLAIVLLVLSYVDHRGYLGWQGDDRTRYQDKVFTCIEVIDGDTIDIDVPDGRYEYTRVRLRGVDSPEVAWAGHEGMYFGPEASAFTKELLLRQAVRIELAPGRTRDRFGRLLAYVYDQDTGKLFNGTLIEDGFGYADDRFDDPRSDVFAELEDEAREHQRGLWAAVARDQMPAWKRKQSK